MKRNVTLTLLLLFASIRVAAAAELTVRLTNADGAPLADAVVFVPGIPGDSRSKVPKLATVVQRDRVFDPFVTVVEKGAAVDFPNHDTVMHHVYSFSPARRFEIKLYKGVPPAPITFDGTGVVVLGCNVHDWMLAYIVVMDTRAFAKTGADGVAKIPGIPDGTHELMAWYPGMKEATRLQSVKFPADNQQRLEARLNVPAKTRPKAPPFNPMRY